MAEIKKFQTESRQLLNLMINSIYSNKEIFLRELISNSSDALDKRKFYSIQNKDLKSDELKIEIKIDEDARTIAITDNGIGMGRQDLEENLGTIARSGTREFIEELETASEQNGIIGIGQFGVGFYSSFIIADRVDVVSRKIDEKGYQWSSEGVDSYSIEEFDKNEIGTTVTLHVKEGSDYDQFLEITTIESLIKKYSDYIQYPVYLGMKKVSHEDAEDAGSLQSEETESMRVVNSQLALWKKDKKDITSEEYNNFYKNKYLDINNPADVLHVKAEGSLNYELLVFIPRGKPFNYDSPSYKGGLDLYSKGILIDQNVNYLLPDFFSFVRGIVDSQDLNLNISREMLQRDNVVNKLAKSIENRIKKELLNLQKRDRLTYNKIFDDFGRTIIFGMYENYGKDKELVKDLVMFKSNLNDAYVTLREYVERNPEQDEIYYAVGATPEQIKNLPVMRKISENDKEVLYFVNDIDEFAIQTLGEYDGRTFISVSNADFNLDSAEEKNEIKKLTEDNQAIIGKIKDSLSGKVSDVKLTNMLKDNAVSISSVGNISLEMEKILSNLSDEQGITASKVLELNPYHEVFKKLNQIEDDEILGKYAKLLYHQAMLLEGLELDDSQEYAMLLDELIVKSIH